MKEQIILCTGGARSGKSEFAEKLALSRSGRRGYVATAQVFDEEMKDRVDKHKARRDAQWTNYEIPMDLLEKGPQVWAECDVVLVDCLTMYVTNRLLMVDVDSQEDMNRVEEAILADMEAILQQIKGSACQVIFVTNEVGLSIVPENKLARFFRDVNGKANRLVASHAEKVYLTISGITIELRSQEVTIDG